MRRTAIIFSLLFVISIPFDQIIGSDNTQSVEQLSNDTATDGTVINKRSVHRTGSRDTDWFSTLVDSSKNGYGAYLETPNPLAYSIDNGWVAVYRQWGGFDATAGIGNWLVDGSQFAPAGDSTGLFPDQHLTAVAFWYFAWT